MSYYFGFRHGWLRIGRHMVCWHDARLYPYLPGRRLLSPWKVWVR